MRNRNVIAILFVLVIALGFNVSLLSEAASLKKKNAKLEAIVRELDFNFFLCKQLLKSKCS